MLETVVFNVGDGDAILVREKEDDGTSYTMLIDTGRPCLEAAKDSARRDVLTHLNREGVRSIDLLVLTHLHVDHVGGMMELMRHIPVKSISCLYLPPRERQWIMPPAKGDKSIIGLCQMLNLFSDICTEALRNGTELIAASAGTLQITPKFSLTTILPSEDGIKKQKHVYDSLYAGKHPKEKIWYEVSKERNNRSLMHIVTYAGRNVFLTGDRYVTSWEKISLPEIDFIKLPHHGDCRSMNEAVIKRMRPQYAVVSCENSQKPGKKPRPDPKVIKLLQKYAGHVYCTENKELPTLPAATYPCIRYIIEPDGSISCLTE